MLRISPQPAPGHSPVPHQILGAELAAARMLVTVEIPQRLRQRRRQASCVVLTQLYVAPMQTEGDYDLATGAGLIACPRCDVLHIERELEAGETAVFSVHAALFICSERFCGTFERVRCK